jgi:hypothetical protein
MVTNFYLNNLRINPPNNWKELFLELNFDSDDPNAQVNVNDWDMGLGGSSTTDGAVLSNKHLTDGLTGGVGIFEGLPFRIELEHAGAIEDLFQGYLDLTQSTFECDLVTATSVEEGGVDWLNDVSDSVSFEYLYDETNLLNDSDFVNIPYVVSSIPKAGEAFMLTLTAFVTVNAIKQAINDLKEIPIELANPISAIGAVLKAALLVLYIGTLIVAVVKLIIDAVKLIIQPVKYHKGMYIKDLLSIGCEHFGLTFKSTIFEQAPFNRAVIIPTQNQLPDDKGGLLGFLKPSPEQLGYYNGTFGELLRSMKLMFNAKIILKDGVLTFERKDFNLSTPVFELPPIQRNGYQANADDFLSNLYLEFSTDLNDKNTIQQYDGTAAQITVLPKKVINKRMVLTKGFERRSFPYALAKIKTELTVPEKIVKGIAKVVDPLMGALIKIINSIIGTINKIIKAIKKLIKAINSLPKVKIRFNPQPIKKIQYTPIGTLIDNRIGMLTIENDFISTPKIVLIDEKSNAINTKISSDNKSVLNSVYLYNNFHFIDSFDSAVFQDTNQYKIYQIENVPFCYDDYIKVKNNNKLYDGEKEGLIDSLSWNIYEQTANIKFRINEIYTNNLETKIITSKKGNPNV